MIVAVAIGIFAAYASTLAGMPAAAVAFCIAALLAMVMDLMA
jgi:hypothetical protein